MKTVITELCYCLTEAYISLQIDMQRLSFGRAASYAAGYTNPAMTARLKERKQVTLEPNLHKHKLKLPKLPFGETKQKNGVIFTAEFLMKSFVWEVK